MRLLRQHNWLDFTCPEWKVTNMFQVFMQSTAAHMSDPTMHLAALNPTHVIAQQLIHCIHVETMHVQHIKLMRAAPVLDQVHGHHSSTNIFQYSASSAFPKQKTIVGLHSPCKTTLGSSNNMKMHASSVCSPNSSQDADSKRISVVEHVALNNCTHL